LEKPYFRLGINATLVNNVFGLLNGAAGNISNIAALAPEAPVLVKVLAQLQVL